MMWNDSWGTGQWLGMTLMMLLVVVAGGVLVVWLVREFGSGSRREDPRHISPEEIVAERFARGEIDEDEFARRKGLLGRPDRK